MRPWWRALTGLRAGWTTAALLTGMAWEANAATSGEAAGEALRLLARSSASVRGEYAVVEGRTLAWSVAWQTERAGLRRGEVRVTGADFAVRATVQVDVTSGAVAWQIDEGRIDLGAWWSALSRHPRWWSALTGVNARGVLMLSGRGEWAGETPRGELWIELRDATVGNEGEGWTLEGVTLRAGGAVADLLARRAELGVAVRTITTSRFGARAFAATAAVTDGVRFAVKQARVEIAGGEVEAQPFAFSTHRPALDVTVEMKRVGLQDLVVFVPTTLSDARGRVNGRLNLSWTPETGVEVGAGRLSLEESEPTTVRMTSNPGFLTENVPARFTFLPASWGWLSRLFSAKNEAYDTLSLIERGKVGLRVEEMAVRLTPEGDDRGRSAMVFIRARPEQGGSAVGEVTFEINVSGPLASVLKIGVGKSLSFKMR